MASEVDIGRSAASPPANPEPSPKKNVVACEVPVIATGARPSGGSGDRELFTEDTTSVLVFENGGVIRLSAAVIPGQLLFLTNQESKREVVAQVILKRNNRPTDCYVELEFNEPSPGFWGIDFAKLPELPSKDAKHFQIADLVQSAEKTIDDPETPAPLPDVREVQRLKQEVEALRRQLQLLRETQNATAPLASSMAQTKPAPHVPTDPQVASPGPHSAPVVPPLKPAILSTPAAVRAAAKSLPAAPPLPNDEPPFAEEDLLPKPALDFKQVDAKVGRYRPVAVGVPAGSGSRKIRLGFLIAAVLLVAIGAAWKVQSPSGSLLLKNFQPHTLMRVGPGANSASAPPTIPPRNVLAHSNSSSATQMGSTPAPPADTIPPESLEAEALPDAPKPEPLEAPSGYPKRETQPLIAAKPATVFSTPKRTLLNSSNKIESVSASPIADGGGFVPPKLIRSVRPVVPREALRDFVTGNVTTDATIDFTGRVKSAKALAGPAILRKAAVDAVKQYRYQPAMQDGKPVPAHLKVTIQFWFEP